MSHPISDLPAHADAAAEPVSRSAWSRRRKAAAPSRVEPVSAAEVSDAASREMALAASKHAGGNLPGLARAGQGMRSILESVQNLAGWLQADTSAFLPSGQEVVARSESMRRLLERAARMAQSEASVLIEGESGTGKELMTRWVHGLSRRAAKPLVSVNCAALSETLVESELFGHEKGSFTGATESRVGRFELASQGTILLDEISEMSVKLQAKLLRALEEQRFERVGGTRTLQADFRVIATTNRRLEHEVAQGRFRLDLYYRLNVARIELEPLRRRKEDIPPLVEHFIHLYAREGAVVVRGIAPRARELLLAYDWPGNVRQLRNTVHVACILAQQAEIQPEDLPAFEHPQSTSGGFRGRRLEDIEREAILSTLREVGGNRTQAARILGVTSRTLHNKIKQYQTQGHG